jgi:hypothetical protein
MPHRDASPSPTTPPITPLEEPSLPPAGGAAVGGVAVGRRCRRRRMPVLLLNLLTAAPPPAVFLLNLLTRSATRAAWRSSVLLQDAVIGEGVWAGIGPQEGFKRTHSFLVGRYLSQAGVPPWVGSHSRLGMG